MNNIKKIDLKNALSERYLAYSLSTIMDRALPDVRDGMKPVHRRILYAMRLLKLFPDHNYAKSSRIVGDVMGKFHPHGDASIYDALVRLAQDFSMRYPLIDGQGNFGNIDGDNAAAMRYTEARMTNTATLILQHITEDAVDFRLTYNEEDKEPKVLPAAFPNILANGASGIAVGMATSIPPHNVDELCGAALYLIENPTAEIEQLLEFVKGPDFPTGGILIEPSSSILEAYKTGRGSFRLRSKWHTEDTGRGTYQIVVTEIPWQVQKSKLVEKIAELLLAKKIPLLNDVRDESAEDIRLILEPKNRHVNPDILMESLFKLTDLEAKILLNMNVLSYGKIPNVLPLNKILLQWLEHRKEVLIRRSNFRLQEIRQRLEILAGYLIAYLNIDEIIRIIREEDDPKYMLQNKFSLTDLQTESILNMRLRSLRKLEEDQIKKEFDQLNCEKSTLDDLINSDKIQWLNIAKEIQQVKELFSYKTEIGKRRTQLEKAPNHNIADIQQSMIEKEDVTVIISKKGWIRSLKTHLTDLENLSFKDSDNLHIHIHAKTTDKLVIAADSGKFYTLNVHELPTGRGHGEPLRLLIDLESEQQVIAAFIAEENSKYILASEKGYGFVINLSDLLATTRKGKQVMLLADQDKLACCKIIKGDTIAVIGSNRRMLIFSMDQLPELQKGKGVRLQKYKDAILNDITIFYANDGLTWRDSAQRLHVRQLSELTQWISNRAAVGKELPRGFPKSGKFS
ncbi:DNA topoisomerase IV subunit A [Bartonella sp. DGB1]|uniref:DNA topoisomerase IV subunit A n=1 Tax=Bartonella sp. DGB1 TaxID=3239807 RepID=UPI003523A0BE